MALEAHSAILIRLDLSSFFSLSLSLSFSFSVSLSSALLLTFEAALFARLRESRLPEREEGLLDFVLALDSLRPLRELERLDRDSLSSEESVEVTDSARLRPF